MKKVLFITYYWPPAGGPAIQRVLKFAKYLPEYGYQPIVLTVENPDAPSFDKALEKEIPACCKVYKTKSVDYLAFYKKLFVKKGGSLKSDILAQSNQSLLSKLMVWVRQNLFIPDAKIGWKRTAVQEGIRIAKEEQVDLILSSSPPHTVQLIAKEIAQTTGLPWVTDLRDPWTNYLFYQQGNKCKWVQQYERKLERKTLLATDKLITVSQAIAEDYAVLLGKEINQITNGYDFTPVKNSPTNKRFKIRYLGSMIEWLIPHKLFRALANSPELKNIDFQFFGNNDPSLAEALTKYGLSEHIKLNAYISYEDFTREAQEADLLLLCLPIVNGRGILSGKLFEYLGAQTRILAIANTENRELREIIQQAQAGEVFSYEDDLKEYLEQELSYWKSGNYPTPNTNYIQQFHRKELTKKLALLLDDALANSKL